MGGKNSTKKDPSPIEYEEPTKELNVPVQVDASPSVQSSAPPLTPEAETESKVTVVLGAQWGDEGKGKLVDILAQDVDVVCRFNGGNNAGHSVVIDGQEFDFHLLPSGFTNENCINIIGNGMVVHLPGLFEEIKKNEEAGLKDWGKRLIISNRAHLVFDFHQEVDKLQEKDRENENNPLGTTKKGIGPAYSSKALRNGVRVADLLGDLESFSEKYNSLLKYYETVYGEKLTVKQDELESYKNLYADKVRPIVQNTTVYLHSQLKNKKQVLAEGANAAMLDLDFGTYPYVTSSSSSIGGVCTGLGLPPKCIGDVYGVIKAYTTRVGDGPFPTELNNDIGDKLRSLGREFGTTTGRPRRCGWLDLVQIQYTTCVNGYTAIALTKIDILDSLEEIMVGVKYKLNGETMPEYEYPASAADFDKVEVEYKLFPGWGTDTTDIRTWDGLPTNAKNYIKFIEGFIKLPIRWIGVGKGREATIFVQEGEIDKWNPEIVVNDLQSVVHSEEGQINE